MKKQKRLSVGEVDRRIPEDLYQDVIALDKSDLSSSTSLLDSVYGLLHVDVQNLQKSIRLLHVNVSDSARPTTRWALRWLLTRFSYQESSFPTEYRAWLLFLYLIKCLPFNVVNELLRKHDFLGIVSHVMSKLQKEWPRQTAESPLDENLETIEDQSRRSLFDLCDSSEVDTQTSTSKKRKREAAGLNGPSPRSPTKCFCYIVEILRYLQQPASGSDVSQARPGERQAALQGKPEETISILANGLSIFSNIIETTGLLQSSAAVANFDDDLCQPLVHLHEQASQSERYTFRTLLECTPPALRLLATTENAPFSATLSSKIGFQLHNLIAQICIHPFRTSTQRITYMNPSETPPETDKSAEAPLRDVVLQVSEESPEQLVLLFGIAFDCCQRNNMAQKIKEDHWLRHLFATLSHAHKTEGTEAMLTVAQGMLEIANIHGLQIPATQLLHIFEQTYSETSRPDRYCFPWRFVALCLTNHASIFLPRSSESMPSITTATLDEASSLFDETIPPVDLEDPQPSDHSTYDMVINEVLIPMVKAFSKAREMETFLMLWSQRFEQSSIVNDDGNKALGRSVDYPAANMIWTDARLLLAIAQELKHSMIRSRRSELLGTWAEVLNEDAEKTMVAHQFVILITCLLACVDQEEAKMLSRSDIIDSIVSGVWKWLQYDDVEDTSIPWEAKSCKWLGWQMLSDLMTLGLLPEPAVESLKMASAAAKLVKTGPDQTITSNQSEPAFAWSFLLNLAVEKDSSCKDEKVKALLKKPWDRISGKKSKASEKAESIPRYHVRVGGAELFTLECIMFSATITAGTEWFNELFTDQIIDTINKNAFRETDRAPTKNPNAALASWTQLREVLDAAWQGAKTITFRNRLITQHIRTFKDLQEPSSNQVRAFETALERIMGIHVRSVASKDKSELGRILNAWLESDLWTLDDANPTLFRAHALLHKLGGASGSCSGCKIGQRKQMQESGPGSDAAVVTQLKQLGDGAIVPTSSVRALTQEVARIIKSESASDSNSNSLSKLATIFWEAYQVLNISESSYAFVLAGQVIRQVLQVRQSTVVGQIQVDELFALVSFVTSARSNLDSATPDAIYLCLSKILGTLLSDYRHRINGRYHLIVSALKGLLWCLFEPQQGDPRPGWLAASSIPLPLECAEQFTRLLTSLGDPSVSAARVGNKQSGLNDPTKKARSIAGQHLSQLIISFCSFQLRGRLDPGLRDKINPGLYAIMAAMSKDVMQNMSASMNPPERAIFKILYDDWRKFGRYHGS